MTSPNRYLLQTERLCPSNSCVESPVSNVMVFEDEGLLKAIRS